jgi:hypothetical protein
MCPGFMRLLRGEFVPLLLEPASEGFNRLAKRKPTWPAVTADLQPWGLRPPTCPFRR